MLHTNINIILIKISTPQYIPKYYIFHSNNKNHANSPFFVISAEKSAEDMLDVFDEDTLEIMLGLEIVTS